MAKFFSPPTSAPGARAADYAEIEPVKRNDIIAFFNDRTRKLFGQTLGLRVVDLRVGYARLELDNRPELSQPAGMMHGGASFGLADTAVAAALRPLYGVEAVLLTIEMKINYLEAILDPLVVAEAAVLRASPRSAYAEVEIWSGEKLAARATSTYMIRGALP
jgi:acyl-CoA thioesterase